MPLSGDSTNETTPPVSPEEARLELTRILESLSFRSSPRCQDFLRHVVEQTLTGAQHGLKERTIGVELFGRSPTYDTSSDGIVRIRASEVRKRLALYYADGGRDAQIHIALPQGSYHPAISRIPTPHNSDLSFHVDPESAGPNDNHKEKEVEAGNFSKWLPAKRLWVVSLLIVAAIAFCAGWVHFSATRSVSSRFWEPLTSNSEPVLVVTSYTPVYLPPAQSSASDAPYRLMTDRYVGGGDLVAAVLVSSMLASSHHLYNLKMNTAITLDDLRNRPTVLIGYASTQWADITKSFRFFVQRGMVTDRGQDTDWRPHHAGQDNHVEDDYAIISRAYDPETHSMIVLVAGCTGYGTEEAARLVTDPKLLAAALGAAPGGWQQKNLQLVLHIEIVANSPANAQVVASYYW